jgi:DNA-binding NarL/FixJ family response regulator
MGARTSVLILDPDPMRLNGVRSMLENQGYHISVELDRKKGLTHVSQLKPDLVIANICLLGEGNQDLLQQIKSVSPSTRVVITSLGCSQDVMGREMEEAIQEELSGKGI